MVEAAALPRLPELDAPCPALRRLQFGRWPGRRLRVARQPA